MKNWKVIFTGALLLLLAACGGNDPAPQAERLQISDVSLPDTYDEETAKASYGKYCAMCHGGNLEGAGAYPQPITGISKEEVYISTIEGVGVMPARLVTGEEAENLAVWIAAQE